VGPVHEVLSNRSVMVGTHAVVGVLQYLDTYELVHMATIINKDFNEWARSDVLWKPICNERWKNQRCKRQFLCLVDPAAAGNKLWTARGTRRGSWCGAYQQAEGRIKSTYPIFAMQARLRKGVGSGLNLFEPRYKMLARRASAYPEGHHLRNKFVFCTVYPEDGVEGWVTEMRRLQWGPQGTAQFIAVPLAKCRLMKVWNEAVPGAPYAPKLAYCHCEELSEAEESHNDDHDESYHQHRVMQLIAHLQHRLDQGDRSAQVMEMCRVLRGLGISIVEASEDDEEGQD